MLKLFLRFILVLGFTAFLQSGKAQLIYFSDSFGQLGTVDISSGECEVTLIGQLNFNGFTFTATDLAFHPNGKFYATDGSALYEIDITTLMVTLVGNHNTSSTEFINALVCDSDGVLYAADTQLFTININNGNATSLGNLPCESAGDLAFNENELYLACENNVLLKVDIDNPATSQVIGDMVASHPFFGIVTYATECSDVQTFGTAGGGLYAINLLNANTSFFCELTGAIEVYGAAMETDFIASDCEFVVDLDGDNSSGALGYDFFADTLCGNASSAIVDDDFYVIAEGAVDSMLIYMSAGILDGNDEQLILTSANNMNIFGSGTTSLKLISTGSVSEDDIEEVLENVLYINMANPISPGTREVTVQIFGEEDNESNIAIAFLTFIAETPFSINLGPDSTLCLGETLLLDAFYSEAISYEWNDGSMNSSLMVNTGDTYSVTVTDDCGLTASDEVIINFENPVEILDLGPDTTLCPGQTLTLNASLVDGIDYQWSNGLTLPVITVNETGIYAVSVTSGCGTQTGSIAVEYQEIPTFEVLPEDTLLCIGESLMLDATLPGALAYQWQDGSSDPVFTASESGIYQVTVTLQCGVYNDDLLLSYNDYELTVDLGTDTTFCFGEEVVLTVLTPYANDYEWQDGSTSATQVVNTTGNYSVSISDGCTEEEDQIYLEMISCCNIYVPNVFSPNFDGANDRFLSFSNCEFPVFTMKIFNRWGAVVFETEDQYDGWDGIYQNKEAQQGVYIWMITYNDGLQDQLLSGDLTLVR